MCWVSESSSSWIKVIPSMSILWMWQPVTSHLIVKKTEPVYYLTVAVGQKFGMVWLDSLLRISHVWRQGVVSLSCFLDTRRKNLLPNLRCWQIAVLSVARLRLLSPCCTTLNSRGLSLDLAFGPLTSQNRERLLEFFPSLWLSLPLYLFCFQREKAFCF